MVCTVYSVHYALGALTATEFTHEIYIYY